MFALKFNKRRFVKFKQKINKTFIKLYNKIYNIQNQKSKYL